MKIRYMPGAKLSLDLKEQALRSYVHRFTGDHTPRWAIDCPRPDGKPYPVQFANDSEWLANTDFPVANGRIHDSLPCRSRPTWPKPESD